MPATKPSSSTFSPHPYDQTDFATAMLLLNLRKKDVDGVLGKGLDMS
jgi:hypothetical protein